MPSQVSSTVELKIRGVIFREGDQYVVQGLEYDISAFGKTLELAQKRFAKSVLSMAVITHQTKGECMAGVPAAPKKYFDLFKASAVRVQRIEQEDEPLRAPIMSPPAVKSMLRFVELEAA